jgi:uncharacterized protein YbjT (DUF2867 family)
MSNSQKLIAVVGATGQQGGATARHLLAKGFKVRALTRDPQKPAAKALADAGAEVVYAENNDPQSLEAAFTDADGVFSVAGFWEEGPEGELRQGKQIADAAKAAGVRHFVYSSVDGAERNSGVPHFESKWKTEQHIRELGLPATILRPVEFMENFNWSRAMITNGRLIAQVRPSRKRFYLAVDDIGAFAAIAFEHPEEYIDKAISIAGDALTEQEIAETFSKVIGRPVQLVQPPVNPLEETGDPQRDDLVKMLRWFDEYGYQADIDHLRTVYPPLQTFETWLRRNGWENAEPMPMDAQGS